MEVFRHHIYEYKKGLRRMVLYTASVDQQEVIEQKLLNQGIEYLIIPVTKAKINVFFGDAACIHVIRSFNIRSLSHLTHEQDFILGTLLGYDLKIQCERYLGRIAASQRIQEAHRLEQTNNGREAPLVTGDVSPSV